MIASIAVDRKQHGPGTDAHDTSPTTRAARHEEGDETLRKRRRPDHPAEHTSDEGSSGASPGRVRPAAALLSSGLLLWLALATGAHAQAVKPAVAAPEKPTTALDPQARLLAGDHASEYWTLFVELDSGHRITQRFLITNAGPGDHSAVAVGHLMERGRPPYRYVNGRQRNAWTLSPDRLYLDIAASHLDLHRPRGALKITKDDVEIRLHFDFSENVLSARVPAAQLPSRYFVEVLAAGAVTQGTIKAPRKTVPLAVKGHTWLVHTWTPDDEAALLERRVEVFGRTGSAVFYGLQITDGGQFAGAWQLLSTPEARPALRPGTGKFDSRINFPARWKDGLTLLSGKVGVGYPVPDRFDLAGKQGSGVIRLSREWLRFDPLDVIPQPFRWFVRRSSQPQEVWADTRIAVSIRRALEKPSLPPSSETERVSNSQRETEDETTDSNVTGVASITFMNPIDRR